MENGLNTVSIATIVQMIVALSIYNVWLLRSRRATNWRGGEAKNMREEFAVYGLPGWFMGVVGFLKLTFATLLLAGVWVPALTKPAAKTRRSSSCSTASRISAFLWFRYNFDSPIYVSKSVMVELESVAISSNWEHSCNSKALEPTSANRIFSRWNE